LHWNMLFPSFSEKESLLQRYINILQIGLWTWKMSKGELLTYQFCTSAKQIVL
jgi:hypothetical protein